MPAASNYRDLATIHDLAQRPTIEELKEGRKAIATVRLFICLFVLIFVQFIVMSLVTQPMLQRRPNQTELRSMDSYIQILCRFQKCKRKVPPQSLLYKVLKKAFFFKNFDNSF